MSDGRARARALWAPIGRLEREPRALALFKLANVGLAMAWGFVVTFVFVRVLPIEEFRAFLLLVAFANFTVSADFGFSGIIYARLRRFRLIAGDPADGEEDARFRPRHVGLLFAFMAAVVLMGGLVIAAGLASGHIPTRQPGLFMAFYLLTATNIFGMLAKRALAALDRNLLWDVMEAVRRALSIILLCLALVGMPILLSVCLQILLALCALFVGLSIMHHAIGMRARDWLLRGEGPSGVLRHYMRDMSATMLLTLSDVAAYNAPYFGIAMATRDPRPLLVFDFVFKMSRALTAVIRALVEALLPRLTAAFHGGRPEMVRARIRRLSIIGFVCAAALGALLVAGGTMLSSILFDGKAVLGFTELALTALLLLGLSLLCVSTFVHNGLGRFGVLLPPSFAFLAMSVVSVPLGDWIARAIDLPFATGFLCAYAAAHILVALRHALLLRRIRPA